MKLFIALSYYLVLTWEQTNAKVFPSNFIFPTAGLVSVNGSSATGNCSDVTTRFGFDMSLSRCDAPTTSVLFDGIIPTLTGLDGDMWASQLLTLQKIESQIVDIVIDFTDTPGFSRIVGGEVVMFNCPELGISVQTIRLLSSMVLGVSPVTIGAFNPAMSCGSLVRVCLTVSTTNQAIELEFILPTQSDWVHLAEVTFYENPRSCTPGPINIDPAVTTTAAISEGETDQTSESTASDPTPQSTEQRETNNSTCSTSIALATVITAIATALLATVISVLVQIAVWKCHRKSAHVVAEIATSAGGDEQEYKDVDGGEGGVADPTYVEVGDGREENTFQLKENEAYGTHLQNNN